MADEYTLVWLMIYIQETDMFYSFSFTFCLNNIIYITPYVLRYVQQPQK